MAAWIFRPALAKSLVVRQRGLGAIWWLRAFRALLADRRGRLHRLDGAGCCFRPAAAATDERHRLQSQPGSRDRPFGRRRHAADHGDALLLKHDPGK